MLRNYKKGLMLYALIIFIGSACSAQSNGVHSEKNCEGTFTAFDGLPSQVLVGTDMVDISSFKNLSQKLKDNYMAEMGGATLTIHITQNANGKIFTRTYQEPGSSEIIRQYAPFCIINGYLSANNLKGKLVEGGLLLLEDQPDIEGIPDNLWIFYKNN